MRTKEYGEEYNPNDPRRKNTVPNKVLDFVLGAFGLIGLVIQLIRQQDNVISWGHFLAGFLTSSMLGIILIASVCVAAIESVDDTSINSCYYDSYTNTSVVTTGSWDNVRTYTYPGDRCR